MTDRAAEYELDIQPGIGPGRGKESWIVLCVDVNRVTPNFTPGCVFSRTSTYFPYFSIVVSALPCRNEKEAESLLEDRIYDLQAELVARVNRRFDIRMSDSELSQMVYDEFMELYKN